MEEKKIGILSIIALIAGALAFILSIFTSMGLPMIIPMLLAITAIILGIIALIKKEKIAMPIIGMSVSTIAIIIALVLGLLYSVFRTTSKYVNRTIDGLNTYIDDYNSRYNNTYSNYYNTFSNYTNTYNFNSLYNTTNTTNSLNTTNSIYTNTTTNTTSITSDGQKVGTASDGYVVVPKNWTRFYDPDASGVFQYSYANVYIVTLKGIGSSVRTIDEMAEIMKEHIAAEGTTNIDVSDATIGGYAAKRVRAYYPADNVWLEMYYISVNNKLYYISIEGPDKDSDNFKIPNTFTLY